MKNSNVPSPGKDEKQKAEKAAQQRRADGEKFISPGTSNASDASSPSGAQEKPDEPNVPQGGEDEGQFRKK
jgi:hypothetical protein